MEAMGIGLIVLGVLLFLTRFIGPQKSISLKADRGGVVVGGNSTGVINTGTIDSGTTAKPQGGLRLTFDIIAGICSIVGFILTVYTMVKR